MSATDVKELEKQLKLWKEKAESMEEELNTTKEQKTIYVARERKIPTLKGRPVSSLDPEVTDWIDDVKRHIKTLSSQGAIEFILDHVAGAVRKELRYRAGSDKLGADKMLEIISKVFGEEKTSVQLKESFYRREQRRGETVYDYSQALLTLVCKLDLPKKDQDESLKERFAEGVSDEYMRRDLRRLKDEKPDLEFWEMRDQAIRWLGNDQAKSDARVGEQTAMPHDPNQEVLQLLKTQQGQINWLMRKVSEARSEPNDRPRRGYNAAGERVCFRCGSNQHLWKDCPQRNAAPPANGGGRPISGGHPN